MIEAIPIIGMFAVLFVAAYFASPGGKKQLSDAIKGTSKGIDDLFPRTEVPPVQVCTIANNQAGAARPTALPATKTAERSTRDDNPCKPQQDAKDRAAKSLTEAINRRTQEAKDRRDGYLRTELRGQGPSDQERQIANEMYNKMVSELTPEIKKLQREFDQAVQSLVKCLDQNRKPTADEQRKLLEAQKEQLEKMNKSELQRMQRLGPASRDPNRSQLLQNMLKAAEQRAEKLAEIEQKLKALEKK